MCHHPGYLCSFLAKEKNKNNNNEKKKPTVLLRAKDFPVQPEQMLINTCASLVITSDNIGNVNLGSLVSRTLLLKPYRILPPGGDRALETNQLGLQSKFSRGKESWIKNKMKPRIPNKLPEKMRMEWEGNSNVGEIAQQLRGLLLLQNIRLWFPVLTW